MSAESLKKSRSECAALPRGWIREEVSRRNGLTAGRNDIYYYSPAGKKVRSKQELIKLLGDQLDLSTFDYGSGKLNASLIRPRSTAAGSGGGKQTSGQRSASAKASQDARSVGSLMRANNSLLPPIRQTASIFKQPVTVVKAHEAKVKSDIRTVKDKPRQLFWEKRLSGLSAYSPDQESLPMTLPENIKGLSPVMGRSSNNILLASISTALHLDRAPVTGQADQDSLLKNPAAFVNPDQPLISGVQLSDADIAAQEVRVSRARERLADAIKALS